MPYSGETHFYRIPYMKTNDYLSEEEETRRANTLDGLLFVATYGTVKAVVEDCRYALSAIAPDSCRLTLSSLGGEYVAVAIVGRRLGILAEEKSFVIPRGEMQYLYMSSNDAMDTDPSACSVAASATPLDDEAHLLLCTVDYRGETPILDTDTDKQYLASLAAHAGDSTNPHGRTLTQTRLRSEQVVLLGSDGAEHPVPAVEYRTVTLENNAAAVTVEDMTPLFATAVPTARGTSEVAVSISGNVVSVATVGAPDAVLNLKIEGTLL